MHKMKSMMLLSVTGVIFLGGCQTQGPATNAVKPSAMTGMAISTNGVVVVRQVAEGFPADLAGIRPGDEILQIGDRDTTGMPLQTACELLRGPQGSTIPVVIRSGADNTTRSVTLGRRLVSADAKWKPVPASKDMELPAPIETAAPF